MIPYGRQSINEADIAAVTAVLQSDFLTQGPVVPRFENAVANYLSSEKQVYAVAMNSATSALHVACMALGVGPGDLVWTSANSFAASANCALYCGAKVDFVDIDPLTLNLCPKLLELKLQQAELSGFLPKVVIPVDFAGRSADIYAIRQLANKYNFRIIEDASHAIGASYQRKKVAAHGLADITIFSFHPVKIITTAEGGMALTHSEGLYKKLAMLRSHGITRDPEMLQQQTNGEWYYEQQSLGYNYRLTDIHAALGLSQLDRIDQFIKIRHSVFKDYVDIFSNTDVCNLLILPPKDDYGDESALHLYPIQISTECKHNRGHVFDSLRSAGIGVNVHYLPIYWHPYYQLLGFKKGLCPNAERYYQSALSLPMHANLSPENIERIGATVIKVLTNY